jgi:hypothetical protein
MRSGVQYLGDSNDPAVVEKLKQKGIEVFDDGNGNKRLVSVTSLIEKVLPALKEAYRTTGKIPFYDQVEGPFKGSRELTRIHWDLVADEEKEGVIILVHTRSEIFPAWKVKGKEALKKHYWETGEVLESALVPREEWPEEIVKREKELGIDGFGKEDQ